MKEVAKLQIKDRTELFQATAISMGMQPNVIEKRALACSIFGAGNYRFCNVIIRAAFC